MRFAIPVLPEHLRKHGCRLERFTFDAAIGAEWVVLFKEDAPYARAYPNRLDVLARAGLVGTPQGPVAYLVWQIAVGTPQEVHVEHWIDIHDPAAIAMLTEAGGQSHLKLVIYDLADQGLANMIEFPNTFMLDDTARQFADIAKDVPRGNFAKAVQYVMANMSLDQILGRA